MSKVQVADVMARAPEFVLGTVQIGLDYGVTNPAGRPDRPHALDVLRQAAARGVTCFDTARAYGDAEALIGEAFQGSGRVQAVTKLDPLAALAADAPVEAACAAAAGSLDESRRALRLEALPVVQLHRPEHLHRWGGAVWRLLLRQRDEGRIGRLGVSLSTPSELLSALACPDVTHIQCPMNLLDHRWEEELVQDALEARPDVVIHVRSVLLQGLLAAPDPRPWRRVAGPAGPSIAAALGELAAASGRRSLLDLSIAYVRSLGWVDGVVIGVVDCAQLEQNLELFAAAPRSAGELAAVRARRPRLPDAVLNPNLWRLDAEVSA